MPFAPKDPVKLDPPKDDLFTAEELAEYDGVKRPQIYVAIKGTVFDVSSNAANYGPEGGYRVFVAKDASRALAKSSLKTDDAVATWQDLDAKEKKVLDDWYSYFSQRYNVVGKLA